MPVRWPFLGHSPAFYGDIPGFLLRAAREQGDVARFCLWNRPALLFAHPDGVRSVLIEHANDLAKGGLMQRARRLLGDGLLTSEGDVHRTQRRRLQPAFARAQIERYAAAVPAIAAELGRRWNSGRTIAINEEMDRLTVSVVARTLFGQDRLDELPVLCEALSTIARWAPALALPFGAWLERAPVPAATRLRAALSVVEDMIARLASEPSDRSPLLTALVGEEPVLSAEEVRDQVMTIFLTAHDTTSAALSWTWLLLARHPRVERKLAREWADAADLTYAGMIVQEVLRLYPPVARVGRRTIADVDIAGVHVPAGTSVFVSPFVTHRDPRWFDRPEEFIPERWALETDRPALSFFPFGAGRRSCIGESFAREVMTMAVATLAGRWRFDGPARLPRPRSILTTKPRSSPRVTVQPQDHGVGRCPFSGAD